MGEKETTQQPNNDKTVDEGTVVHSRTVRTGNKDEKTTLEVDRSTAKTRKRRTDPSEQVRDTFGNGNVF